MLNDQMNLWANFFICVDGSVRNSNIYVCKNIEVSSYLVILAEHMNDLLVGVCVARVLVLFCIHFGVSNLKFKQMTIRCIKAFDISH